MNGNRNHHGTNFGAPKRRWEAKPQYSPPAKKARHDNHHFQMSYAGGGELVLPDPIPELPAISPEYEKLVFTHPSLVRKGQTTLDMEHYDRLEFLGDAYLEIIASRIIFEGYPRMNAGGMCKLRESVVKNETLSKYSTMYGFDKKLNINEAPKDGNKGWTKVYGDVFEAYAAAVVLSDPKEGEARLHSWLKKLWAPVFQDVREGLPSEQLTAKEELAKKVLCKGIRLNYVEERKPILHKGQGRETFFIGVYLDGWGWKNQHLGSGEGIHKNAAGHEAALKALDNHPLIDEIIKKREAYLAERAASEATNAEKQID